MLCFFEFLYKGHYFSPNKQQLFTIISTVATFTEKSPYTVTYEYSEATDGGPTGSRTFQLPILYTVWPIEKPLPEDLHYEVDYEVFLPRVTTPKTRNDAFLSSEALQILELEVVSKALDIPIIALENLMNKLAKTRALDGSDIQEGRILSYDNVLQQDIPLANMRLRAQLGTYIRYTTTNSEGNFEFSVQLPSGPSFYLALIYHDPLGKWEMITGNNSTEPYEVSIGLQAQIPDI